MALEWKLIRFYTDLESRRIGLETQNTFMRLARFLSVVRENADLVRCWHVTPVGSVRGILKNGLEPRVGPRSKSVGEDVPQIYVFTSWKELVGAVNGWLGVAYRKGVRMAVLELNVPSDWLGWSGRRDISENIIKREVPPTMIKVAIPDAYSISMPASPPVVESVLVERSMPALDSLHNVIDLRSPDPIWTRSRFLKSDKPRRYLKGQEIPMDEKGIGKVVRGWWVKPEQTFIVFQTDDSAYLFYYTNEEGANLIDGKSARLSEIFPLIEANMDKTIHRNVLTLAVVPQGLILDSSRDDTNWSGATTKFSPEPYLVSKALVGIGMPPQTRLYSGNWARQDGQLLGQIGKLAEASPEKVQDRPLVLFHGTSNYRAAIILRDGLKPLPLENRVWNKGGTTKKRPAHRDDSVYLSADRAQAEYYAGKAVKVDRVRFGRAAQYSLNQYKTNVHRQLDSIDRVLSDPRALLRSYVDAMYWGDTYQEKDRKMAEVQPDQIAAYRQDMLNRRAKIQAEYDQRTKHPSVDVDKMAPVLLQITIPKRYLKNMMADDDWLSKRRNANNPGQQSDWRSSIGEFGQVAFRGSIPPSWIKVLDGQPGTISESLNESFGGFSRGAFWINPDGELIELPQQDGDYDHWAYFEPDYREQVAVNVRTQYPDAEDSDIDDEISEYRSEGKDEKVREGWVRAEYTHNSLQIEAANMKLAQRAAQMLVGPDCDTIYLDVAGKYDVIRPEEFKKFLKQRFV